MAEQRVDVVVVGGGLSGLACAGALAPGTRALLLEAQDRFGGRVFPSAHEQLAPGLELDLGAEFVHGDGTVLHQYAAEEGWALRQIFIWAHGDGGPLEALSDELDLLSSTKVTEENKTWDMARYLASRGVSRKGLAMAQAGYGNTLGASLEHLSLGLTCRIERLWDNDGGDTDYRVHPSCRPIVERLVKRASARAQLRSGARVESVHRADDGSDDIIVSYSLVNGRRFRVRTAAVTITVPIPILQGQIPSEQIQFRPALPADKRDALERLRVRSAMKIVARFSSRFWPEDMHGTICADCPIPEFWVKEVGAFVDAKGELLAGVVAPSRDYFIVVGFAMAGFAANLAAFTEGQILDTFVSQLDMIFGGKSASKAFEGGFVFDWSKVPYIRGGYSFPSVHEREDTRALYARSEWNGRLHFAGEGADDEQAFMTMHAAIRTGERAAARVNARRASPAPKL